MRLETNEENSTSNLHICKSDTKFRAKNFRRSRLVLLNYLQENDKQKMVLFILIFFVMIIVVGAAAVLGFSFYLKRRTKRLKGENQKQFAEPPPYRSLFEPTEKELENFQKEEDDKLALLDFGKRKLESED